MKRSGYTVVHADKARAAVIGERGISLAER